MTFSVLDQSFITSYPDLPAVTTDDWSVGPADAPVTLMEYSEPQCPYCAQLEPALMAVHEKYPNNVRLVFRFRPFPESFHDKSILMSQAMEAAGKQGKFQEFKNWVFERQYKNPNDPGLSSLPDSDFWAQLEPKELDKWLEERIPDLGLEPDQFFRDMYSDEIIKKIQKAMTDADTLEINGTPKLFINGYSWPASDRSFEVMSIYVELILNRELEYNSCPEMMIDTAKTYTATITTSRGDIVAELYDDIAPYAVNSFIFLAKEGWYEGLPMIVSDQFVLSGDPSGTGYGGPGYVYLDEISDSLNLDESGLLAVFGLGSGLNGSNFFINKTALTNQEGRTIFGKVISGMDVVNSLENRENIFSPVIDRILKVTIAEK